MVGKLGVARARMADAMGVVIINAGAHHRAWFLRDALLAKKISAISSV